MIDGARENALPEEWIDKLDNLKDNWALTYEDKLLTVLAQIEAEEACVANMKAKLESLKEQKVRLNDDQNRHTKRLIILDQIRDMGKKEKTLAAIPKDKLQDAIR